MRQHQAGKADLEKHRGLLTDAEKEAAARRAEADDAARRAHGLPECALALFLSPQCLPLQRHRLLGWHGKLLGNCWSSCCCPRGLLGASCPAKIVS